MGRREVQRGPPRARRDCRQKRRFVEHFSRRLTHLHQQQSLASPTGRRRRAPRRRAAALQILDEEVVIINTFDGALVAVVDASSPER